MDIEKYKNIIISEHLERVLNQLEAITRLHKKNGGHQSKMDSTINLIPAHGREDERKEKVFPRV